VAILVAVRALGRCPPLPGRRLVHLWPRPEAHRRPGRRVGPPEPRRIRHLADL